MPQTPEEKKHSLDNPFYYNYVFNRTDLKRLYVKWWEYPILWFLPTHVQVSDGYVFYFKLWQNRYYLMKTESL